MKILFVCLGNICRSPIAEGVLKRKVQQKNLTWHIASAGTNKIHTGEPPHPYSQQVCKEMGIDISAQRARDFIKEDIIAYDKIYVMAADVLRELKQIAGDSYDENKIDYFLNELYPHENKSVVDPWYGTLEGYYDVYDQIEKTCTKIIEQYS